MTSRRDFLAGLGLGAVGGVAGTFAILRGDAPNMSSRADQSNDGPTATRTPTGPAVPSGVAAAIRAEVNEQRESVYGGIVPDLKHNEKLDKAAAMLAGHLAETEQVGTTGPGDMGILDRYQEVGAGTLVRSSLRNRIKENGCTAIRVGAADLSAVEVASEAVGRWAALEEDRDVILARPWAEQGAAAAYSGSAAYIAVNFI